MSFKTLNDLKKFFLFFRRKKQVGINFGLLTIGLLFLPSQGYYQTLQNNWQAPKIISPVIQLPPPSLLPINVTGVAAPEVSAQGILVIDLDSAFRLLEKNPQSHFPPASTTKMTTALVALDYFKLDDVLTVPALIDEGQDIKLAAGEKMTLENLLYALLVASANDAAETIASNYPGGRSAFVEKMNEKAGQLSLQNTHFVNPSGLDGEGQYSSPFDLALMARAGLNNPEFAQIVQTQKTSVISVDGRKSHVFSNINQLLGKVTGVLGVKTGFSEKAGECLVAYIERDGRRIITVVLGSKDRFGETEKLINWVFDNFQWVSPEATFTLSIENQ